METIVACHQPNFLPWLGFFAKIARSNAFVMLDDVQFTQGANKHNWTSRVRIATANGPIWLSMPVRRSGEGRQLISDLKTDDCSRWLPKMMKTLDESYRKAPHAGDCLPQVIDVLSRHQASLCDTNIELIRLVCKILGLNTPLVPSSERGVDGVATTRLVNLTRSLEGTTYLSGDGADDYQLVEEFREAGIQLRKLGFRPKPYSQPRFAEFVPGLSIIDAICCVGIDQTREMIKG